MLGHPPFLFAFQRPPPPTPPSSTNVPLNSPLSNLVNNLSEGIKMIKKCGTYGIKYKYCDFFLEYINFKDDLIEYKCFVLQ